MSFPCSLLAFYKRVCNLRCKLSILISISSETQASNAIDAETIRPQMNIFQAHERAPTPEPDSPTTNCRMHHAAPLHAWRLGWWQGGLHSMTAQQQERYMDMAREHFWKSLSTASTHLLDDTQRSSREMSIATKIGQSVLRYLHVHGELINLFSLLLLPNEFIPLSRKAHAAFSPYPDFRRYAFRSRDMP